MKCDNCESLASQTTDMYSFCDKCWCRNFGTITIGGVKRPFLDVLQESLENMGLDRKDGESVNQWGKRCRESALNHKILGGLA